MKTTAAVVHEIEELDLEGPREGDVLVRYTHAGLRHSDLHVLNGEIPRLPGRYRTGDLELDGLVTRRYALEQVNEGYADLLAGKNIRGVVVHEHD